MDIPVHASEPSLLPPEITYSEGIAHLTLTQEKLLQQQFRDLKKIHIEKQFNTGYSGAKPYVIAFPASNYEPVVAKFDHPVVLRRERAAYVSTVKGKLGSVAPNQGELIESADGSSGLLIYSYVGITINQIQSYEEYIKQNKDTQKAIQILNRIFGDGLGRAAEGIVQKQLSRQQYYDRLLPPHLQVTAIDAPVSTPHALQAGALDLAALAKLSVGQLVQLRGFKVHKRAVDGLTLYDNLSPRVAGAPVRLKLQGIDAASGDELPPISAVITATRTDLLDALARAALPTFTIHSETFTAYGCTFPNPVHYYKILVEQRYEAKVAIMHGDLHLENILLDKYEAPWLIDFAKTSEGPVLFDLQYMEARLLTTLLCDKEAPVAKSIKLLSTVLYALHRNPLPPGSDAITAKVPRGVDRNLYLVLVGLRQLAQRYLAQEKGWAEYYRGLTLALLQLLKFSDYSQSTRQLALVSAAIVFQWADLKEAKPVHCPTRLWPGWAINTLLAVLCMAVLAGWYYFPNLWHTSTTEAAFTLTTPINGCMRKTDEIRAYALLKPPADYTSIFQRVKDRGVLLCGVEGTLSSFSLGEKNEKNGVAIPGQTREFYSDAVGLDADICRVVATAVFGNYRGRVAFTNLSPKDRFPAILNGDIDLLARNTTWTAARDISIKRGHSGIDFGPITFHDGQRFLVRAETPILQLADLKDKRVCVQRATTTYTNTLMLSDTLGLNLEIMANSSFSNTRDIISQFAFDKICDAVAGDTSQLMVRLDDLPATRIIPEYPISYEPLAPAFISGDTLWREIVNYAVWTTIYAEEIDVTQENIDTKTLATFGSVRQRFHDTLAQIEPQLQLNENALGNILRTLGNYGEIYTCNLGPVLPERGPNQPFIHYDLATQSWLPNLGGRLFAPPFVPD